MRQINRYGAFLACAVLCLFLLCGCHREEEPVPAPVQLTALQYELENMDVDFPSLWFYQALEADTGVHVSFEEVKDSEWNSRVSLAFSSGDLPDLILRGSLDVEEYGVGRGELVALDPYIEKGLLPHYASRLSEPGIREQVTASDGHMYEFGFLISQGVNTNGHFFIRKDWLEQLGLSMPETVEELHDVLVAFRDGDPNGNGLTDEIPLELTWDDNTTGLYNLFSFWGLPLNEEYVYLDGDTVRFAPAQPAFLEAARTLHTWYQEGLLDPECISQGSNLWAAKVNQDTCGMFSYWRLENTALQSSIAARYQVMLPVHADGVRPCLPRNMDIVEFGAAVTRNCQHVEAALAWLDAQFQTETMLVSQNGRMGDTLMQLDDGRYAVRYVPEGNELYRQVPVICGQFFAPPAYYDAVYLPASHRLEKQAYCRLYEESGVLEETSFKELTVVRARQQDEDAQISALKAQLKHEVDATLVRMVTQGVEAEDGTAFLARLEKAGMAQYCEVYQTIWDRTGGE